MSSTLSPLFTWRSAIASKESGLTGTQRHVALTLSLHMSEKGDSCFPSMPTLVDETGLGLSTVRDAMRRLNECGWLEREVSHRRGRTNRYRALIPVHYRQQRAVSEETAESEQPNRQEPASIPPVAGHEVVDLEDVNEDVMRARARANLDQHSQNLKRQLGAGVCAECLIGGGNHTVDCVTGRETPRRAYREFVEKVASDPAYPLDELGAIVATWRDLDDVERDEFLELADGLRAAIEPEPEEEAA